jgi:peptidoglycan/LPS O-acetylase OafA/YrhL
VPAAPNGSRQRSGRDASASSRPGSSRGARPTRSARQRKPAAGRAAVAAVGPAAGPTPEPQSDSSPSPPHGTDFRPDIEGLRGVAIALVLAFHVGLLSAAPVGLPGGFIGVDLFFVVSGFLITGLLLHERERTGSISFSRFYARRVRRILPAAAVTLLVTIPLAYAAVGLLARPGVMTDGASAALSIANIRFALTTDYFHPSSYSPFLHYWSLGVEEQFYLVWPLLFLVAGRLGSRGAAWVLGLVLVASFAANVFITGENPSLAFYLLPSRAWQMASGGLLAIVVQAPVAGRLRRTIRRAGERLAVPVGWVAAASLVVGAVVLDQRVAYPGLAALLPTVAGVALIATGSSRLGPGALLRLPPVRFLGRISYSLYLWHWPTLIIGGLLLNGPDPLSRTFGATPQLLSVGQAFGLAALSVPIATVSWAVIEEPFRRGQIRLPRPGRLVAAGVGAMAMLAVVGTLFAAGAQEALTALAEPASARSALVVSALRSSTPPASPTLAPTPSLSPGPSGTPEDTPVPQPTPALTPGPSSAPVTFAVTSALRPALPRAPGDVERPWADGCLTSTSGAAPPAPGRCVYGDPKGSFVVALIGDSHASALFPAVNAVARAHGWKLLVFLKVDCKFADMRTYNDVLKREYVACEQYLGRVTARLDAAPPDLVLIAQGRYFEAADRNTSVRSQGEAIAREIGKLPASSRVVLIGDYPYPWNEDVPTCLAAHLSDYRRCAYSRTIGFGPSFEEREQIASALTGVPVINTATWTCPGTGSCPVVINGMIVFRDEHHLTATYSASLGPALDAELARILGASSSPAPSVTPTPRITLLP